MKKLLITLLLPVVSSSIWAQNPQADRQQDALKNAFSNLSAQPMEHAQKPSVKPAAGEGCSIAKYSQTAPKADVTSQKAEQGCSKPNSQTNPQRNL